MTYDRGGLDLKRKLAGYFLAILLLLTGCSEDNKHLAYVSTDRGGEYEDVVKELNIGTLINYHLRLPKADETWVRIWVEAYREGEKVEPFFAELNYGLSPNKVDKGHMGLGIVQPYDEEELFFLYAPGVKDFPHTVENNPLQQDKPFTWGYTFDKELTLDSGDTETLGVYYQSSNPDSIEGVDFQDESSVQDLISRGETVLLIKMNVEERHELPGES